MSDLVESYLKRLQRRGFSAHTLRAYQSDLRQAAAELGNLEVVSAAKLERYIDGLSRRGLRGTTIRRKQSSIRGFFDHARRMRARDDDPTIRFEPPKLEARLPIHFSREQVAKLFAALRGETIADKREAAIVKCLYYTGMRASELLGLDWENVSLESGELRVFGKGRKERVLPIPAPLAEALAAWRAVHPTGRGPVFVSLRNAGQRLDYGSFRTVFVRALERAGLSGYRFSPHKMRHTFATRLVNQKVGIEKIQKLMGHRKIDTTMIYAHADVGSEMGDTLTRALG